MVVHLDEGVLATVRAFNSFTTVHHFQVQFPQLSDRAAALKFGDVFEVFTLSPLCVLGIVLINISACVKQVLTLQVDVKLHWIWSWVTEASFLSMRCSSRWIRNRIILVLVFK
jgi:hypothetical protein